MTNLAREHLEKVNRTATILNKIDTKFISSGENELRLFVVARNESLRLPYFLDYYFGLGVDRVFLIDNNSTDDTRDIALKYNNTHVFRIDEGYKNHWYWMEYFLETYGKNRWCIVVDVDELLFYPKGEVVKLKMLIDYFERHSFTALECVLLDIFSEKTIKDTLYTKGQDPLAVCPYFDKNFSFQHKDFVDKKRWVEYFREVYVGGARQRVFGVTNNRLWKFCLSKIPLLKYSDETYLAEGMHAINGARMADLQGVVFHTKFMYDFIHEAQEESERGEHFSNGVEYKFYNQHLNQSPDLVLKDGESIKYENSAQLAGIGLMKTSPNFDVYIDRHRR